MNKRQMLAKLGYESFGAGLTIASGVVFIVGFFTAIQMWNDDGNSKAMALTNKHVNAHTTQNASQRVALLSENKSCTATFIRTLNKGQTVTVTNTSYEQNGIMEKYYIEEQGGRWYYADVFGPVQCS